MKKIITSILFICLIFSIDTVYAHPGRTDSSGCHTCRTNCGSYGLSYGQYHCHNSGSTSAQPVTTTRPVITTTHTTTVALPVVQPVVITNTTTTTTTNITTTKPITTTIQTTTSKTTTKQNKEETINKNLNTEEEIPLETVAGLGVLGGGGYIIYRKLKHKK